MRGRRSHQITFSNKIGMFSTDTSLKITESIAPDPGWIRVSDNGIAWSELISYSASNLNLLNIKLDLFEVLFAETPFTMINLGRVKRISNVPFDIISTRIRQGISLLKYIITVKNSKTDVLNKIIQEKFIKKLNENDLRQCFSLIRRFSCWFKTLTSISQQIKWNWVLRNQIKN